ncbi:hypothetical protein V5O48_019043 [Marasmius crinis-equi]|uniref:Uncharacterized protein n=1 Tax=Marasmius crinis-equi TaxID=585013 RepID=A0ABR3EJH6_9AGAR
MTGTITIVNRGKGNIEVTITKNGKPTNEWRSVSPGENTSWDCNGQETVTIKTWEVKSVTAHANQFVLFDELNNISVVGQTKDEE